MQHTLMTISASAANGSPSLLSVDPLRQFGRGQFRLTFCKGEVGLAHPRVWGVDAENAVEPPRAGDDPPVELLRVVRRRQVHRLIDLVVAVEPLEQIGVAVVGDNRVDILEHAHNRPHARFHVAELPHTLDEVPGVLAVERDVPVGDDVRDDLVDQRRLPAALLAVEEVAAPDAGKP